MSQEFPTDSLDIIPPSHPTPLFLFSSFRESVSLLPRRAVSLSNASVEVIRGKMLPEMQSLLAESCSYKTATRTEGDSSLYWPLTY